MRRKAREIAVKIPLLTVRPMLLAHLPDIIDSGVEIRDASDLYERMVQAWLERESPWVSKETLRVFSEHLGVVLYLNRESRGTERMTREELSGLATRLNMDVPQWKLTGRSLLEPRCRRQLQICTSFHYGILVCQPVASW